MDQNLRSEISSARFFHFQIFLLITYGILVATMLAIVFGNTTGKEYVIGAIVLASGILGILGTTRTMDDLGNLIKDLDDKMVKTNYGEGISKAPIPVLKAILIVFYLMVAGTQIIYLFG